MTDDSSGREGSRETAHRGERAGAIAEAGGVEEALRAGSLPRHADVTLSEAIVLGLLRQGVRTYLCVLGHGSTDLGEVLRVYEEAKRAGVSRVVQLSGYDVQEKYARPLGLMAFAQPMLDVQAALAASSFDWTVLGCGPSMEMFFAMIRGTRMMVPGGGPPALPTLQSHLTYTGQ